MLKVLWASCLWERGEIDSCGIIEFCVLRPGLFIVIYWMFIVIVNCRGWKIFGLREGGLGKWVEFDFIVGVCSEECVGGIG